MGKNKKSIPIAPIDPRAWVECQIKTDNGWSDARVRELKEGMTFRFEGRAHVHTAYADARLTYNGWLVDIQYCEDYIRDEGDKE